MTGLEPFAAEAVKALAGMVIKTAWEMANRPLDKPFSQAIFNASRQYFQNYAQRHGMIKVLGMGEPVPLEAIYIAAQILDNWLPGRIELLPSVDIKYRQSKRRLFGFGEYKKRAGLEIANHHQYLMVLGEPGMGKSTFLRKIGLDALKGRRQSTFVHACIPVFIELKMFKPEQIDIEGLIARELEICGFPDYQRVTRIHLLQGKFLILLDGLDEVISELLNDVTIKINDFVDRYPKNRFVVSCRRAAYRFNFHRFNDVAIADFEDKQIQHFISNWFSKEPDRGKECWKKLTSVEYEAAKELTHTPLLLTLICLLYERAGQFPTNRSTLYNRALRVLLEEWAAEKSLPQEHIYKGLDTRRKELLLSKIAHDSFREDTLFLDRREVATQIERLLKELLPEEKIIDGEKVLRSIEAQHGILVERAVDIYSFSHLTLQEFLTAQYIADDHEKTMWLIANCLVNDHWHEVFLLVAGLKQRTDDLLVNMEKRTQVYCTNVPKLRVLLSWARLATNDSPGKYRLVAKQSLALALALDCKRALEFAFALERIRATVRRLLLAVQFNRDRPIAYVHQFEIELNRAFKLARLFGLSRNQAHDLANKLGIDYPQIFALELKHGIDFAQMRELIRSFEVDKINTLSESLNQARINVFNAILTSDLAQSFAQVNIFQGVNFQVLATKLEALKENIPGEAQSYEVQRGFIRQMGKIWFESLKLKPDLVELSSEDLENLEAYLKANKLMVECKKASVWVKPATWKGIEERMLVIKEEESK